MDLNKIHQPVTSIIAHIFRVVKEIKGKDENLRDNL